MLTKDHGLLAGASLLERLTGANRVDLRGRAIQLVSLGHSLNVSISLADCTLVGARAYILHSILLDGHRRLQLVAAHALRALASRRIQVRLAHRLQSLVISGSDHAEAADFSSRALLLGTRVKDLVARHLALS